jgi:tetratricopeptide (TPR) repeat protein
MAYDLAPLGSYVRFYVTVVEQLESVWSAIDETHDTMKSALGPFEEPLRPVEHGALKAALGEGPRRPPELASLWRPRDRQNLSGLNDLYEVAGRFSFQGDDNENLSRLQQVVAGARNELQSLRIRLADLGHLPETAKGSATKLSSEEGRLADMRKNQRMSEFGPLAQTLQLRAKQTVEAVRAVAPPELTDVDNAADEYRKYAIKVDQVYQTCLPFLRKSVQNLYAFVGLDSPPTWPDSLPLVKELPPELLAVPPVDSPELKQSRNGLYSLDEEEIQLGRMRDEVAANVKRLEGEIEAHLAKDTELKGDLGGATARAEYATALDQVEQMKRALASYEQQKAARLHSYGEIWQRHQQIEQAIKAIDEELRNRAAEISAFEQELETLKQHEPVLFGKDDWRSRVGGLEGDVDTARAAYTQRIGVLNQLKIDHSAMSVQVQTEQTQTALIDRWITDSKTKREALEKQARELEARLGPARPGRPISAAEGQEGLLILQQRRAEITDRVERLRAEIRRRHEEGAQVAARFKQIEVERLRVKGMIDSAQTAATQGRDAALRQLAAQRRGAVDRHLQDVLGGLEKSLAAVDSVFIEAARDAMFRMDEPRELASEKLRDGATRLGSVVEALARSLDPEILAQDAMLGQIQRDFCDVALDACKKAWS